MEPTSPTIARMMSLEGRRAVVTGAAGGIGRVIAQTLAELGAQLVLVDRPGADTASVVRDLESRWQVRAEAVECDLEREADRARLVANLSHDERGVALLVNNAAFVGSSDLSGWIGDFEQQTTECWRRALELNLTAAFDLSRGLMARLRESGVGSIINIGSIYGKFGPDYRLYTGTGMGNPAAYAASKGGLLQLTRWLATTLAPAVRVNSISPGGMFRGQPEEFVRRYEERTPLGRMGTEDDLRGVVGYLASDLSSYCTGQDLAVDGGWGVW